MLANSRALAHAWRVLFVERRLPWRLTHLGGFWNTSVMVPFRRLYLPLRVSLFNRGHQRDDVSVVIGIRNRADQKLRNALSSISLQTYPRELIETIVVDYGSEARYRDEIRQTCDAFGAKYVRVENKAEWNRARCLNVGIGHASAKYVMTSDADIILAPSYLAAAITKLRSDPLQVIYAPMLDLPEHSADSLSSFPHGMSMDDLKLVAQPRTCGDCHESINLTLGLFFRLIGGYDEFYEGWGTEDNDIAKRFEYLGLVPSTLKNDSFYLHQWHPRLEGYDPDKLPEQMNVNWEYFTTRRTIVRKKHRTSDTP